MHAVCEVCGILRSSLQAMAERVQPQGDSDGTERDHRYMNAYDLYKLSNCISVGRNIVIEFTNSNSTRTLSDPRHYIDAGHCRMPPHPTIGSNSKAICVYTKKAYQPGGTSGLLSYAYGGNNDGQERIVVFWQVPQFGSNKFGIAWSKLDTQNPPNPNGRRQPNAGVVHQDVIDTEPSAVMYKNFLRGSLPRGQFKVGTARETGNLEIRNEQDGVILRATMADNTHAILKIEFRSQEQ